MAKVYIVTSGSYSDFSIDKVFLDENKAELYKDNMNKTSGHNDYIVEIYDTFDDNITDSNMKYAYCVEYNANTSKISILDNNLYNEIIYTSGVEIEVPLIYIDPEEHPNSIIKNCYNTKNICIYRIDIVTPKLLTYNQIEKIVYDRVAEYKAKENNI
ncbi:MAG: hypothetical protein IKR19_08200 [Acholeplasmatales bacterium]|nr:hypothetical protein [Acholeplasmatales bacterium]